MRSLLSVRWQWHKPCTDRHQRVNERPFWWYAYRRLQSINQSINQSIKPTVHLQAWLLHLQFDWNARPVDKSPWDDLTEEWIADMDEGNIVSTWLLIGWFIQSNCDHLWRSNIKSRRIVNCSVRVWAVMRFLCCRWWFRSFWVGFLLSNLALQNFDANPYLLEFFVQNGISELDSKWFMFPAEFFRRAIRLQQPGALYCVIYWLTTSA